MARETRNRRVAPSAAIARCALVALFGIGLVSLVGCDNSPPPRRVPVPTSSNPDQMRPLEYVKPLPPEDNRVDLRVREQMPEPPPPTENSSQSQAGAPPSPAASSTQEHSIADVQRDFADAFRQVGQPHIAIFVNHTLDGQLVPVSAPEPWNSQQPQSTPPATAYLRPDQYNKTASDSVDYDLIENKLVDWISNKGQIPVIAPATVRQKLSATQINQLQSGQSEVVPDIARALQADVLIQVQPHPTQQTQHGLILQLAVQAINVNDRQEIADTVVTVSTPLDQSQADSATKSIARDVMVGMLRTWTAPPGQPNSSAPGNPPGSPPPPAQSNPPPPGGTPQP